MKGILRVSLNLRQMTESNSYTDRSKSNYEEDQQHHPHTTPHDTTTKGSFVGY